ncbi:MAG: glycogen debranching N-terminal domain-containing protein [Gemmatimonadales bacterium]
MEPVAIRPGQRSIWHGPSLFVLDAWGAADETGAPGGFYFRETRFLNRLRLELNGSQPWPCAIGRAAAGEILIGLAFPELLEWSGGGSGVAGDRVPRDARGIPWRALDLMLRFRLRFHRLEARLAITNRTRDPVDIEVGWRLDADFADLLEAGEAPRTPRAPVEVIPGDTSLRFAWQHPALPLETAVVAGGPGDWHATRDGLFGRLRLDSQIPARLTLVVEPRDTEPIPDAELIGARERSLAGWRKRLVRASARGNQLPVHMVNQAIDDLASLPLLEGEPDEWLAPAAGIPLYPALFGRDAITAAWQASLQDSGEQLGAVLARLGRLQGTEVNPANDEEPGRIVHSVRRGPLARLGENPFARYYGDQASPFMFVIALAQLYAWTGRDDLLARHWDAAERVLDWARERGDRDRDGYVEYLTHAEDGPKNQGWKDSGDGIIDEWGGIVEPPIATCEVQGYWFAAQQLFAALCAARGRLTEARAWWAASRALKTRFNRDWWMPEEGYIGLALDRDKRLVRSLTSNVGHCLASGIVSAEHVPEIVGRAFLPDLWSGWGLRTLSSRHPSYNPIGYHLGSVWTVENATFALGLRRYGFDARAVDVATAIIELAERFDGHRAPETVGGYPRAVWPHPSAYPRANPLQAWNQSAVVQVIQTLLGLEPVAPLNLLVVDPVLPGWLPEITLHGLRVGGATADLHCWRDGDFSCHAELKRKRGTLHLLRQPPPESLTTTVRERVSAFVDGLVHA